MNIIDNERLITYIEELSQDVKDGDLKIEWAMWRVVGYVLELTDVLVPAMEDV